MTDKLNAETLRERASSLRLTSVWCRSRGTLPAEQSAKNCDAAADAILTLLSTNEQMAERVAKLEGALRLARPVVEADLCEAREHSDADWEGMSYEALSAIDAALGDNDA